MRSSIGWFLLSLAVLACGADRSLKSLPSPKAPQVMGVLELSSTGPDSLYASVAEAINDSGTIAGYAQVDSLGPWEAVLWRPPNYQIEFLPNESIHTPSFAHAIGADGTIGGDVCDGNDVSSRCHPVYWRAGVLHRLEGDGTVNSICPCDGHTMVGRVRVGGRDHGALWVDDILIDVGVPTGYTDGELRSIAHGFIVGNGLDEVSNGGSTAIGPFRWSPTTGWVRMQSDIQTLVQDVNSVGTAIGAFEEIWYNGANSQSPLPIGSFPAAINDSGVVAGGFLPQNSEPLDDRIPGVWTAATGWVSLGSVRKPIISDINNSALVVGSRNARGRSIALLWRP